MMLLYYTRCGVSASPQTVELLQDKSEPSTPGTSIASRSSGDSTDVSSLLPHLKQAPSTAKTNRKRKVAERII